MQSSKTKITQLSDQLYLICLTPLLRGFENFISVWLVKGDPTYIVDVGPSATSAGLLSALGDLDVRHLDYILLTHIHLDHAGGIGDVARVYPDTPIICHPAGIRHLVDPERLSTETIKALGDVGEAYGPIRPVNKDQLVDATRFMSDRIVPVMTPGHSRHHVSFQTDEYLFVGEAGGVCFSVSSTDGVYMRPATPPRFYLDITLNSIDALIAGRPRCICYGHFGMNDDAVGLLTAHKQQLLFWNECVDRRMANGQGEDFLDRCARELLGSDPLMAGFSALDTSVQERELFFITNSLKGFEGYLQGVRDNSQAI